MPRTLKVIADCLDIAPKNAKLNAYVCSTYLAYGYPKKAYEYYKFCSSLIPEQGRAAILQPIFYSYLKDKNVETYEALFAELQSLYLRPGHSPTELMSLMSLRAAMVNALLVNKEYEAAVKAADGYLAAYEAELKADESAPFWATFDKSYAEDLKKLYYDCMFQYSKFAVMSMKGKALVALGRKDGLFDELLAVVKHISETKFSATYESGYYSVYYDSYQGYMYLAALARSAEMDAQADEFMKLGNAYKSKYDEMQKAAQKKYEESQKKPQ
ncbi:MAG: hypothetical protein WC712_08105 [Candidatus Brocadiia bacterium]